MTRLPRRQAVWSPPSRRVVLARLAPGSPHRGGLSRGRGLRVRWGPVRGSERWVLGCGSGDGGWLTEQQPGVNLSLHVGSCEPLKYTCSTVGVV